MLRDLLRDSSADKTLERAKQMISDLEAPDNQSEEKPPKVDYTADEVTALIKDHGAIADKARDFMRSARDPWPPCSSSDRRSSMPSLPLGMERTERTERLGLPMSSTIATHIDYIMAQRDDIKPSQANKVLRLWPSHFNDYCGFRANMTDAELEAFQTNHKDMEKLVGKDQARKRSIEASRAHAQLGQSAIKNGALVDSMTHVVDEAAAQTRARIDAAVSSIKYDEKIDQDELIATLEQARDASQMVSVINASLAFVGFTSADLGARAVHTAIRALRLEHVKCLLDTEKTEILSQLTRDLPVEAGSLFGAHLNDKIIRFAKSARDYGDFTTRLASMGLGKPRSIASRLQHSSNPFRARRLRRDGGASYRRPNPKGGAPKPKNTGSSKPWKPREQSHDSGRGRGAGRSQPRGNQPSGQKKPSKKTYQKNKSGKKR